MSSPSICLLLLYTFTASTAQDVLTEVFRLFNEGKIAEARSMAEDHVEAHPEDPTGHHALGRMILYGGDDEGAIEPLERCLELSPEPKWMIAWTHVSLGQALSRVGRKEEAIEHLERAIAMNATANATNQAKKTLSGLRAQNSKKDAYIGRKAPPFLFHGLLGEVYRETDFEGRALLLKIGPSW